MKRGHGSQKEKVTREWVVDAFNFNANFFF
jgi:hypothetical protein